MKLNLTNKESLVLSKWLENVENGALTAEELLDDNYSWNSTKNLSELTGLTLHSIAGVISSLYKKGYIVIEEDDLFYIDTDFLESLPLTEEFTNLDLQKV